MRLSGWLPLHTTGEAVRMMERAAESGWQRGFLAGYRQGSADTLKIAEIRTGEHANGRELVADGARTLRLVDGDPA